MKKKEKEEEGWREEGVYMLNEKSTSPKVDRSEAKREMSPGYHWFVTEGRGTHPLLVTWAPPATYRPTIGRSVPVGPCLACHSPTVHNRSGHMVGNSVYRTVSTVAKIVDN
jgi:hypothetical protein